MSIDSRYTDGSYMAETGGWHAEDADWKAGHIKRVIAGIADRLSSVCDFGCGSGDVLARLAQNWMKPETFEGWELAREAFALSSRHQNPKLVFHNESLLNHPAQKYDLLLMMDVFEHVEDYIGMLRNIREHATWFVFHIPLDASAMGILQDSSFLRYKRENVGHLHYFTEYTALATLRDAGFEIEQYFFTHSVVHPPATRLVDKVRFGIRKILFSMNAGFYSRFMGGCSLMVLAKNPGQPACSCEISQAQSNRI